MANYNTYYCVFYRPYGDENLAQIACKDIYGKSFWEAVAWAKNKSRYGNPTTFWFYEVGVDDKVRKSFSYFRGNIKLIFNGRKNDRKGDDIWEVYDSYVYNPWIKRVY